MKFLAVFLILALFSSCGLLKIPARTIKSVGRTFGLAADDASFQIDRTPTTEPEEGR